MKRAPPTRRPASFSTAADRTPAFAKARAGKAWRREPILTDVAADRRGWRRRLGDRPQCLMLPLSFHKRTALLAAFTSRFSLGFFVALINLRLSPIAAVVLVGLLTSVPDAIITKAYAPILATGLICGAIAGWIVGRWAVAF